MFPGRKFPRKFPALALLGLGLAAIGVSVTFAFIFTGPQRRAVRPLPSDYGFPVETVTLVTADRITLKGWWLRAQNSRRGVVLLHGNGSTRAQMIARARLFRQWGCTVLLYDARGHGESGGALVSVGWYEKQDLLAALEFLRGKGCTEMGCLGASQGGATIALAAAQLTDVKWVVLESVYPDILTALDRRFRDTLHLPGWLAGSVMLPVAEWRLGISAHEIAPRKTISALGCPVLIMSGEDDRYTTPADTVALFAAAVERKELWLIPGARHVDLYGYAGENYATRLRAFVQSGWSETTTTTAP